MQDRNKMIADDYVDGRNMIEICREYGLKERRVYQILRSMGVKTTPKRKGERTKKALSRTHERIGRRLYDYYFDRGLAREQAAEKLGMSATLLRNIELGHHNLTLFDLQDISAFIGITMEDLTNDS